MSLLRGMAMRLYPMLVRARHLGRVEGSRFILRKPSLIRVRRGGKLIIGGGTVIEHGARIVVTSRLVIGQDVYVGRNATLVAFDHVSIGDRTLLGENVSVHSEDHGPPGHRLEYRVAPVVIGSDVWIGAGAVVLRGRTVGDSSTVGANAVVTRDVPPDTLAVGVPARLRRSGRRHHQEHFQPVRPGEP